MSLSPVWVDHPMHSIPVMSEQQVDATIDLHLTSWRLSSDKHQNYLQLNAIQSEELLLVWRMLELSVYLVRAVYGMCIDQQCRTVYLLCKIADALEALTEVDIYAQEIVMELLD